MVKKERILSVSKKEYVYTTGPILYVMNRDMRVKDNWALLHAQNIALNHKVDFHVVYVLATDFMGGGRRQLDFKIKALEKIRDSLYDLGISFSVLVDQSGKKIPDVLYEYIQKEKIGYVVTDFSPLKIHRYTVNQLSKKLIIPYDIVDTHNIIPVWITSPKQEFAAYTIRPKIYALIGDYLDEFPKVKIMSPKHLVKNDLTHLYSLVTKREDIVSNTSVIAGEDEAYTRAVYFIKNKLERYTKDRNDATIDGQSNLSPYLHYGQISTQRLVLLVLKYTHKSSTDLFHTKKNSPAIDESGEYAFLEELVIRRELADNFCFYNKNYDTFVGLPVWAQKTLDIHRSDTRSYVYTKKQFENAQTHDPLWNAAQNEMRKTGTMHGYMRMYWAKKILEWTLTPEDAFSIAIYLNDTYQLDGRDPNGYTGIAWSIGGVHDRVWFERPIFGTVRYMNETGCKKKFNCETYIKRYL